MDEEKLVSENTDMEELSQEQLNKELESVAKEILQRQKEEKERETLTNPSAIALTTTKHDSGTGVSIKKSVQQLFNLYLSNQFVARAVNVRADTLISRGYKIIGKDERGITACTELIENSGGINLFWQLSVNTYIAGDGFLEKVFNLNKTKITRLKHVHPLTLSFKKNKETDKIILNEKKEPVGYVQYYVDKKGVEDTKDVPKEKIAHIKFNTLGDEFTGISLIQPGYDTIVRLMNMEYSAAESAVKIANPLIYVVCNTKSPHQIAQWSNILGKLNGKDQIFVPEGMNIDTLSPGQQNFSDYAEYFLNAVVATFGTPKAVLLGDSGGSGNRSEGVVLSRHFYSTIRSDQRYMSDFFNNLFKEYGEMAGFEAPRLYFEDLAEDANVLADSAINLFTSGLITREEARMMIGLEKNPTATSDNKIQSIESDVKKDNMEKWHPKANGSPSGSQAGEKKSAKINSFSLTKPK